VVIPTFNRVQPVQAAIRSVLTQTYPEIEIIVVDDGSNDGTGEALQKIMEQGSSCGNRVRYFSQSNSGQSVARNNGIEKARGQYIAFLDSDDTWLPEKLEWQMRALNQFKNESRACITDAKLIDSVRTDESAFRRGQKAYDKEIGVDSEAVTTLAKYRDPFWLSTLLLPTDMVKQLGSFDTQLGYAEDHDFFFRLGLITSICYVNRPLALLDRSKSPEGSNCRPWDGVEVRLRGSQCMLEKWLKFGSELPMDVRKSVVQGLRQIHSAWANWYLEHGRYEDAKQAVHEAIRYELTANLAIKWTLTQFAPGFARRISPKMRFS
jgi:glycosyltransferase involved in cell wall biosynthesis